MAATTLEDDLNMTAPLETRSGPKPVLTLPCDLPELEGFVWSAHKLGWSTSIFLPERDPLSTGGIAWFERWVPSVCRADLIKTRGSMATQIEKLAMELGHRAAASMEARTGVYHLPDGFVRAYRRYAHTLLGVPMEIVPRKGDEGITIRCWNTARMKRAERIAERRRIADALVAEPIGQLSLRMPEVTAKAAQR